MATFKIIDTFNITNRGIVLVGDIMDNGYISVGDIAQIQSDNSILELKILGVEMVDRISERIAHIGLVFSFEEEKKIKNLNLNNSIIKKINRTCYNNT